MAQRSVLVVDDDAVILKLMTKFVAGEGLRCVSAPDGEEAVARLEEEPFDLLVLDKNLPGINGLVVAKMARKIQPGVPILLVTGYSSEESAREAAAIGVADYLLKPIDIDELRVKLREMLKSGPSRELPVIGDAERRADPTSTIPPPRRSPDRAATLKAVFSVMSEPEQGAEADVRVKVVLIEEDDETRAAIGKALRALECPLGSYRTEEEAAAAAAEVGCQVLVGRPSVLAGGLGWLDELPAGEFLGKIAIMEQGGVDNAIRAIQLGARGMLAPPFHGTSVVHEFSRVVTKLLEEMEQ